MGAILYRLYRGMPEALFAAGLTPVMHVLDWVDAIVDTGRKAQSASEEPGYLASGAKGR